MAYQVIARKWRPQSFHELVGQEHISTTLLNALRNDRLPQALLFTGVRGTGKTSTARILAKSLRCPHAVDFVPCGVCPTCEDIANSRSLDVIEIDGASNNGVDAVRELRETVGYMPSSGKYKVYIIDEVHMLSTSAFNALLKTLEEPPPHVVFIMATTEAQKIPNTILSRCQRFDFRRIASRQIAAQLEKICTADHIKTEQQALWLIARQGDGSMRDSQSLLDQVITFCDGEVTLAKVIDVLGLTDRTVLLEALTALVNRDTQLAVDVIEKVFRAGYDPKIFAQDLLEELRHALMVRLCPGDPSRIVDLPDAEIDELRTLTTSLTDEDLHLLFDMALKGVNDLLRSQDSRIVLEMLLLRMAAAPRIASLAALASGNFTAQESSASAAPEQSQKKNLNLAQNSTQNSNPTASRSHPGPPQAVSEALVTAPTSGTHAVSKPVVVAAAGSPPSPGAAHPPAAVSEPRPVYTAASFTRPAAGRNPENDRYHAAQASELQATSAATAPVPARVAAIPESPGMTESAETKAINSAKARDPWFKFVDSVKRSNSLLGAMLENTHLIAQTEKANGKSGDQSAANLKIGVPKKMSFLFDKIREPDNVKKIEKFLETLWEKTYTVEIFLADEKSVPPGTSRATPKSVADQAVDAHQKSIESAVERNSLVQATQNVFKTQIKSIKETK